MKRTLILLTALAILGPTITGAGVPEGKVYGEGVTIATPVDMKTLMADPDAYVGKKVRVDGVITAVCKKRGCWMQITNAEGEGLRVKVEDGVIVFPYTSMGHKAAAEGVFEAIKLTPEQIEARKAQAAKEHAASHAEGESCEKDGSPAKAAGCDAPVVADTIFMLRGTGAVIQS